MNHYTAGRVKTNQQQSNRFSCQTPGCESVCPSASNCLEGRLGSGKVSLAPIVAMVLLVVAGVLLS